MSVYLAQLLCPSRHCILAAASDASDASTTLEGDLREAFGRAREMGMNPWCAICGSHYLHVEVGKSVWGTMEEAMPALRLLEQANRDVRTVLMAHLPERKVALPGHGTFWFLENEDGSGPLAPLTHCDDRGRLHFLAAFKEGYAHVLADGRILRYQQLIGHREDLRDE